ncbi:MarR family winged helix-turn-helix transcriptional regulator [Maritalea sp.]|uniref:MarR family winged helix-turn-helix transcriptional regulator n=1 Tax=Maritalea sp. TaxID=2003361 RepID=UPI003EF9090A
MAEKDLKPPHDSLGRLVSATAARAQQLLAIKLEPHDLSPQQWIVLGVLWRRDGVSVGELARYMHSEKAAVSRLVDRMEKAGWVKKRASSKDARSILVFATQKAQEKSHLSSLYTEVNAVLLQGFSTNDSAQLFGLLNRAHKNGLDYIKNN